MREEAEVFFRRTGKVIIPLTVKDILEEQLARKLVQEVGHEQELQTTGTKTAQSSFLETAAWARIAKEQSNREGNPRANG